MTWLKCCPRCNGDLCENKDLYGHYTACLQCGHYLSEAEEVVLRYHLPLEAEEKVKEVQATVGSAR